jgi:hypothetical protein
MEANVIKSNFISKEFTGNQPIEINNVISVEVYNNCEIDAYINKLKIRPGQKSIIVRADYSVSDITLNLSFVPKPVVAVEDPNIGAANPNGGGLRGVSPILISEVPDVIPRFIAPEIRQTVVLYYKILKNN